MHLHIAYGGHPMNLATIAGFPMYQIAQPWDNANPFPAPSQFHSSFQGSYIRVFNTNIQNEEQYNLALDYQRRMVDAGYKIVSFCEYFPLLVCYKIHAPFVQTHTHTADTYTKISRLCITLSGSATGSDQCVFPHLF